MKFDFAHIVLAAACGILGWILFTDGCCHDVKKTIIDTSSHVVQIPSPQPDTVYVPDIREIIKTIFRSDTAAIRRLIARADSLHQILADSASAAALSAMDSLRGHLYDSLAVVRDYLETAGDSTLTINVFARTVGYLDSLSIAWKHNRKAAIPFVNRILSVGVFVGSDTMLSPSILYVDRKKRSFTFGYDVLGRGVVVGVHWPVWGR